MITQSQKDQNQADYEATEQAFISAMGLSELDSVDDWIREGLRQLKIVNTDVEGDILKRISIQTKTRALKEMMVYFNVMHDR